ncbi:hypothetical protein DER45DRAFT_618991 [Fusarium avenaceum]|nr:hypothetical protein DER45DRAFT_618991 [Fusarium avenaceum]
MVSSRTDLSHGMRWLLPRFAVIFMATIILPKCLTGSLPPVLPPLPIPPKPKLHSKSIKDIDSMVEKYIQPLQGNPIEMLEIGAGWGVDTRLGASYYTWRTTLLPGVQLDVIEVNSTCVENFERQEPAAQIYPDKLEAQFIEFHPNRRRLQYDVVIDRGFFSMHKRVTRFLRYWNSVSPGGLYILENLSQIALIAADEDVEYTGDLIIVDPRLPHNIISGYTPREFVYAMLDDLVKGSSTELHISDETVECMKDVCVIKKK